MLDEVPSSCAGVSEAAGPWDAKGKASLPACLGSFLLKGCLSLRACREMLEDGAVHEFPSCQPQDISPLPKVAGFGLRDV